MKIGQRPGIIEPIAFRHEALDQLQDACCAINKAAHRFVCSVLTACLPAFIQKPLAARGIFLGRQKNKGQEIARLKMRADLIKPSLSFSIDKR